MTKHTFNEIRVPIEKNNISILRDRGKCIKCGKCKDICTSQMGVAGKYDLIKTCDEAVCINCGQCAKVCPVGAIQIRPHWKVVKDIIAKHNKVMVVSTAPSVRVALGDAFGCGKGELVQGKMIAALRALGFNYVLDVNFGADITVMEEASELIQRLDGKGKLPMFTSCCPAWVKYVETFYPEFIPNLSTCKSPIAMMGTTIKTYFAACNKISPTNIIHVSIAPCTAKKFEASRPEMNDAGVLFDNDTMLDTDYVVTVKELVDWIKAENIDFNALNEDEFDSLMGECSGGGAIFGSSGGVMESTLRTACMLSKNKITDRDAQSFTKVRGSNCMREADVRVGNHSLHVGVVFGTANADTLLKQIKSGEKHFDVVEVMACPGGCIGGGGLSQHPDTVLEARKQTLYAIDDKKDCKVSVDNKEIVKLYKDFYGKPLSNLSDDMLHTLYTNRSEILTRSTYMKDVALAKRDKQ